MHDLSDQLAALVDQATPVELEEALVRPLATPDAPEPRSRRLLAVAAITLLVIGAGSLVAVIWRAGDDPTPSVSVDTSVEPTTVPMVTEPATSVVPGVPVTPSTPTSTTPPLTVAVGLDRAALSVAGVGDLRFGAPVADAEARTGVQAGTSDVCGDGRLSMIDYEGLGMAFLDGRFFSWATTDPGWATVSGLHVGTARDEAMALVPGLEMLVADDAAYLFFPPEPTNLLLGLGPDGRVASMHATDGPELRSGSDLC